MRNLVDPLVWILINPWNDGVCSDKCADQDNSESKHGILINVAPEVCSNTLDAVGSRKQMDQYLGPNIDDQSHARKCSFIVSDDGIQIQILQQMYFIINTNNWKRKYVIRF